MWLSLVERVVRDYEAAGSNPVTPTYKKIHADCGKCDYYNLHEFFILFMQLFYTRLFLTYASALLTGSRDITTRVTTASSPIYEPL